MQVAVAVLRALGKPGDSRGALLLVFRTRVPLRLLGRARCASAVASADKRESARGPTARRSVQGDLFELLDDREDLVCDPSRTWLSASAYCRAIAIFRSLALSWISSPLVSSVTRFSVPVKRNASL